VAFSKLGTNYSSSKPAAGDKQVPGPSMMLMTRRMMTTRARMMK
jgi:hypothetical protein